NLRPAIEEPLIAGQSVDYRWLLAVKRNTIRLVCYGHAAKIANVFTERQFAVDTHVFKRLVSVVLLGQLCGSSIELLAVLLAPPFSQIAVAVVLAPLVVESMADLVSDHSADSAVVDSIVCLEVEEGR